MCIRDSLIYHHQPSTKLSPRQFSICHNHLTVTILIQPFAHCDHWCTLSYWSWPHRRLAGLTAVALVVVLSFCLWGFFVVGILGFRSSGMFFGSSQQTPTPGPAASVQREGKILFKWKLTWPSDPSQKNPIHTNMDMLQRSRFENIETSA